MLPNGTSFHVEELKVHQSATNTTCADSKKMNDKKMPGGRGDWFTSRSSCAGAFLDIVRSEGMTQLCVR